MKELGNIIYWFGCVVAATLIVIVLSWAVLAAIPWLVGRASLFVLAVLAERHHRIALRSRTQSHQW